MIALNLYITRRGVHDIWGVFVFNKEDNYIFIMFLLSYINMLIKKIIKK